VTTLSTTDPLSSGGTSLLSVQADNLIKQVTSPKKENAKIEKSAKDFESILLGNWLQQAEDSFGKLPGGDDSDDDGAGNDQLNGIAMQSLGSSMAGSGGIGIAKMISNQLHREDDASAKTNPG
jgi:Rod binding domain-containing protein